jgi:GntR family transcriptional repressor for pyruvate dehydrogenase complex
MELVRRERLPKAADVIVSAIRRKIVIERLPAGTVLPSESELTEMYGLSRASVREGLRLLEQDGLVEIKRGPGGGIRARHPDISNAGYLTSLRMSMMETTAAELIAFRLQVEPYAAMLAAENATDEQRENLVRIAAGDPHLSAGNADFHVELASMTGNGVVQIAMEMLHAPLEMQVKVEESSDADISSAQLAHMKIAQYVFDGNGQRARRAMTTHLEGFRSFLEQRDLAGRPVVPRDHWEGRL